MKYKLIKEYPGSPKIGNTIDNLENDWIENYSEFWQPFVEKIKQPLFTTEDGVDIFEGDSYYSYNLELDISSKFDSACLKISGKNTDNKYFSTKEKAEEYILMNKPCLSLNDVLKLSIDTEYSYTFQKLKELVKSKI